MSDQLDKLSGLSDPDDPDFALMFTTAHAMYQAATKELHSVSHHDMTNFLDEVTHELDDPAVADYLIRSATGHQRELGVLLTPYGEAPPPLAKPHQVEAMLTAGRAAGMNEVQLWEMSLLLGAEPEDHQLEAPIISEDAAEAMDTAAQACGLPSIITTRWHQLLDIQ